MTKTTIGLLHPGEMGSTVGAAARAAGAHVVWAGVSRNARKAWRFVGEMEEMANTLTDAGLPDGFPIAAPEIYLRLEKYKDAPTPPSLAEVASAIQAAGEAIPSTGR